MQGTTVDNPHKTLLGFGVGIPKYGESAKINEIGKI